MYTVRFYKREKNQWVYNYSKLYESLNHIHDLPPKTQAHIYDEFYEKIKVITGKCEKKRANIRRKD